MLRGQQLCAWILVYFRHYGILNSCHFSYSLHFAKFVCLLRHSSHSMFFSIMTHPPPAPTEPVFWQESPAGTRPRDQANRLQKLGWVWRNRKKISQIIKDYIYLPFFLLIILCEPPFANLKLSNLWFSHKERFPSAGGGNLISGILCYNSDKWVPMIPAGEK